MRTKSISLAVATFFLLSTAVPLSSQNAPRQTSEADHTRHSVAINLLRAINTAEVSYKMTHGSYLTWDALLAGEQFHGSRVIAGLAHFDPELANAEFSTSSEVLPGWSLRLNLTANGEGYDVMLQDMTGKPCGYAAITDERGVIWQSKTIDCEI
ncbi:MAG TPA: hypothetical protein VJW94_09865 [Candidatus Acidoferrum sp.]|nr:hypothetical protein [Candidatus Acidoferrum sp.]